MVGSCGILELAVPMGPWLYHLREGGLKIPCPRRASAQDPPAPGASEAKHMHSPWMLEGLEPEAQMFKHLSGSEAGNLMVSDFFLERVVARNLFLERP